VCVCGVCVCVCVCVSVIVVVFGDEGVGPWKALAPRIVPPPPIRRFDGYFIVVGDVAVCCVDKLATESC
jgi:hypothetical protein